MESDIEYLTGRLSKIDGFGDTGEHLLGIVKSKKPAQAVATETPVTTENGSAGESKEEESKADGATSEEPKEKSSSESKQES